MPLRDAILDLGPVFDAGECAGLVAWSERRGLQPWPPDSPKLARCPADGGPHLDRLLAAVRARLPAARFAAPPVLDRFDVAQGVRPAAGEELGETRHVVIVPLNGGCEGGEVVCYLAAGPVPVTPVAGGGVAFPAFLTWEETPVRAGRRYVLRAEVVCREEP